MTVPSTVRGRGRPTAANGDATRTRCVETAIQEFAAHGYARAGLRSIAEGAGVTVSALYNYFPSKAALYGAAWAAAMDQVYAEYETATAGRSTLADELDAVLDCAAQLIRDRSWIPTFGLTAALDAQRPDLRDHLPPPDSVAAFLGALADRAIERGEIDVSESAHLQTYLTVLLWGISAVNSYDGRALATAIAAAKWSVGDRFRA